MHVHLGSDHGGFSQKEVLFSTLTKLGYDLTDHGTHSIASTDYPEFARLVAHAVVTQPESLGILLCRSGEGMQMAANKVKGIRAALAWRADVAAETRHDNDANILVLPSDFVSDEEAVAIAKTFLETPYSNEDRHTRRIEKISELETREHAA